MSDTATLEASDKLVQSIRAAVRNGLGAGMTHDAVISELDGVMALLQEQAAATARGQVTIEKR